MASAYSSVSRDTRADENPVQLTPCMYCFVAPLYRIRDWWASCKSHRSNALLQRCIAAVMKSKISCDEAARAAEAEIAALEKKLRLVLGAVAEGRVLAHTVDTAEVTRCKVEAILANKKNAVARLQRLLATATYLRRQSNILGDAGDNAEIIRAMIKVRDYGRRSTDLSVEGVEHLIDEIQQMSEESDAVNSVLCEMAENEPASYELQSEEERKFVRDEAEGLLRSCLQKAVVVPQLPSPPIGEAEQKQTTMKTSVPEIQTN